jgi:hypothetical protein
LKNRFAIFLILILVGSIGFSGIILGYPSGMENASDEIRNQAEESTPFENPDIVDPTKTTVSDTSIDESENYNYQTEQEVNLENGEKLQYAQRKFPFPYEAMLAISSDADLTTLNEFETYHRFLNTREETPWGEGLGLDIADSTWMFVGNNFSDRADLEGHLADYSMSYFQGLDPKVLKDASKIIYYYNSGWIDSLHTYGDFSNKDNKTQFKRDYAIEAIKAMKAQGFLPKVWINHGTETNVQNFGGYDPKRILKYQAGDDPKSPYFHTDLTLDNGIKYVWNSNGSNQFAFDFPLFQLNLRDGRKVWGFQRYTYDLKNGKVIWNWEPHELPRQITPEHLDLLVKGNKYAILAQHFGKGAEEFPFNPKDIEALKLLKTYQNENKIIVARTERLLNYARIQKFLKYDAIRKDGKNYINIKSIEDPIFGTEIPTLEDIRGATFYVDNPDQTTILLGSKPISEKRIQRNKPDHTGKRSIGVQWFREDFKDYTKINAQE